MHAFESQKQNLELYAYCSFTVTLGILLTMPNKKSFFDSLLLKIYANHNIESLVRNLDTKYISAVQLETFSTIYSKPDTSLCFDCDVQPLRCVFVQQSFVLCTKGIN